MHANTKLTRILTLLLGLMLLLSLAACTPAEQPPVTLPISTIPFWETVERPFSWTSRPRGTLSF